MGGTWRWGHLETFCLTVTLSLCVPRRFFNEGYIGGGGEPE